MTKHATASPRRGYGFIRQKESFCPSIRKVLHGAIHEIGLPHRDGAVYVCTEGPRLESPAEIRKFRIIGGDLVGMTLAPEAFLARELEMCYSPVCYLVNYAEGTVERRFEKGTLFEGMQNDSERLLVDSAIERFPEIIRFCFNSLQNIERHCDCKDAMLRYKKKGVIGSDWRNWLGDI